MILRCCYLSVLLIAVLTLSGCDHQNAAWQPGAEEIAENNRGVGLMGRFDYEGAHAVFANLVAAHPQWVDARINLAIATLNRQQEGDEAKALDMLRAVLVEEPDNLRAHYLTGLLLLNRGETAAAKGEFRTVTAGDPDDAYAAYYYAQSLMQEGSAQEALDWYQRAMRADPYLRSSYYGAFMALQRLQKREEAKEALDAYQHLADNPRSRLAEIKYTRMGPKAEARAVDAPTPVQHETPEGPLFAEPQKLREFHTASVVGARGLSVVYLDDGPHVMISEQDASTVLAEDGWNPVAAPYAASPGIHAAAWGDVDNDGLVDVYVARKGPNQLWRQSAPGIWEDVTAAAGVAGGDRDSTDALFVDADHDGDLDILTASADGPVELFNNNLDGTFRALGASQGIAGDGRPAIGLATADLDSDRDVDLIVLHAELPHDVFVNDRLWEYRSAAGFDVFAHSAAHAVAVGDANADGQSEIYTLSGDDLLVWSRDGAGDWQARILYEGLSGRQLALADVSGNGVPDVLVRHATGWLVVDAQSGELLHFSDELLEGWALLNASAEQGPGLLGFSADQRLLFWPPGPGRYPFLALSFSGREDEGESMRSNASGIGTHVTVRSDSRWSATSTFRHDSGPGQSLQPVMLGLGGAVAADYIAIDWSDGVFQTELDLRAGETHLITETQRQLASCPVLFVWDGEAFSFVSDLLGVGGIGFNLGRGVYSSPRPWENFQLPDGMLQPRNGRLQLKITEPMEEVAYLDVARLVAYDVPVEFDMVLDERLGTGAPEPTGLPRWYRTQWLPVSARTARGEDVTASIRQRDGVAAPVGARDPRFLGLLAEEQALILEFPEALTAPAGEPLLIMEGWVEYGYSQTGFAAWQAGVGYQPPSLDYLDDAGNWQTLHEHFGYPAGMPRRASVPLDGLPVGTRVLRLRSNQEIYWDRLAVAWAETPASVRKQEFPMARAQVSSTGFPARAHLAQQPTVYDYASRSPFWDTRYPAGFYTALGPAMELVSASDSALAVIGPGEELHLEFQAPESAPPAGWRRFYVLETRGWAKDMDLYTRDGETVGPLPHGDDDPAIREALHARYNTRFRSGR